MWTMTGSAYLTDKKQKTMPLTINIILGLSLDMQIQRSLSKRKQKRKVMDRTTHIFFHNHGNTFLYSYN